MFCRKCGQELPDDALFCVKCGTPIGEGTPKTQPVIPMPKNHKSLLYAIIAIGGMVILAGIIILAIVIAQQNKIRKLEGEMNKATQERMASVEEKFASETPTQVPLPTEIPIVDNAPFYNSNGYIEFGRYEQDCNENNGAEPIEWSVVETGKDSCLVISRYVLDVMPFDNTDAYWSNSSIRKWLNDEFLQKAFTSNEQEYIEYCLGKAAYNDEYDIYDSQDVMDKIFLLSVEDLRLYYSFEYPQWLINTGFSQEIIAEATPYARSKGCRIKTITEAVYENENYEEKRHFTRDCIGIDEASWWLRTPYKTEYSTEMGACVAELGRAGFGWGANVNSTDIGVRPAMLILFHDDQIEIQRENHIGKEDGYNNSALLRSEVKEAIDSYEDFIDSYCDFMKFYDSSDLTMISKYADFMTEYYEMAEKFDAIENMDLNDVEALYYSEVSLRCSDKLLKVAYEVQ